MFYKVKRQRKGSRQDEVCALCALITPKLPTHATQLKEKKMKVDNFPSKTFPSKTTSKQHLFYSR